MITNAADPVISAAVAAALALSTGLRDQLGRALHSSRDWQQFYQLAMHAIFGFEPSVRRTLEDATFAAAIAAGKPLLSLLPPPLKQSGPGQFPQPFLAGPSLLTILQRTAQYPQAVKFRRPIVPVQPLPSVTPRPDLVHPFYTPSSAVEPGAGEPLIRFPLIEHAAVDLAERGVVTRPMFDQLDIEAKRRAFTVARVSSLETLEKLRNKVAEAAAEGKSLDQFRADVDPILEDTGPLLSAPHLETVFRTNLSSAYSSGQQRILSNPVVNPLFPYVRWVAVHDGRVRPDHLAMEAAGLDGTGVFRVDDPLLRLCWPPAAYNCRCHVIILSVRSAARLGVQEAIEWRKSGRPPLSPQWVQSVPIIRPPGWVGGAALTLAA